ncbi:MAG TPA: CDP-alcohol phosphatidyltransferase family protein [Polyangiaceae bacterium]|nr:CDP-alcohol phosphatidyltransferase family protein [Polyangiaceae bacterium]
MPVLLQEGQAPAPAPAREEAVRHSPARPTHAFLLAWSARHAVLVASSTVATQVLLATQRLEAQRGLLMLVWAVPIALSFAKLWFRAPAETASGARFAAPNWITAARLVSAVGLCATGASDRALSLGVFLVWAMDGLDGYLARRLERTSELGAWFDMESDAMLVLVASLGYVRGGAPGYIVATAGMLRYWYLLITARFPPRRQVPRSRIARLAFGAHVLLLCAGLAFHDPVARWVLGFLGSAVVLASFGRSFVYAYRNEP